MGRKPVWWLVYIYTSNLYIYNFALGEFVLMFFLVVCRCYIYHVVMMMDGRFLRSSVLVLCFFLKIFCL